MSNARYIGEVAPTLGRKNLLINGNFDIWQRGTTHSTNGYGSADRWFNGLTGSGASCTMARALWNNPNTCWSQVGISGKYFLRATFATGSTAAEQIAISQRIENVAFTAGRTCTVSFYAKASVAGIKVAHESYQHFGTGGSPSAAVTAIGVKKWTLTTGWARYSYTFTVPDTSAKTLGTNSDHKLVVHFWLSSGSDYNARNDTLGFQSGYVDFAGIQFEFGNSVTDFEQRLDAEELALCQRYYETGHEPYLYRNTMNTLGISAAYDSVRFQVAKRVNPTVSVGTTWQYFSAGTNVNFTPTLYGRLYDLYFTTPGTSLVNWNGWNGVGSWIADAEL